METTTHFSKSIPYCIGVRHHGGELKPAACFHTATRCCECQHVAEATATRLQPPPGAGIPFKIKPRLHWGVRHHGGGACCLLSHHHHLLQIATHCGNDPRQIIAKTAHFSKSRPGCIGLRHHGGGQLKPAACFHTATRCCK